MKKVKVTDAKVVPGKTQKALKAGPHGKATHADGSSQAEPRRHPPTNGGTRSVGGDK
jgi:hypothetical protein